MKIIRRGKTSNYEMFVMVHGNREYREFHAAELAEDIKENNMLDAHPVLCTMSDNRLNVYDGQHRVGAAKMLGIPVPYIVADHLTPGDIARLNRNQKGWGMKDYIQHFADIGKKDYIALRDFIRESGIPPSLAAIILTDKPVRNGGQQSKFKQGKFTFGSTEPAKRILHSMNEIRKAGCKFTRERSFIKAIQAIEATGLFEVERLVLKLKYMPLEKAPSWLNYVEQIDDRYNYHVRSQDKVALKFEVTK